MPEITTKITKTAVVGAGVMGSGIAQTLIAAAIDVRLIDQSMAISRQAAVQIGKNIEKQIAKQKITAAQGRQALSRLTCCKNFADLSDCQLVIEAVSEDAEIKKTVIQKLDTTLKAQTIIASNTSTISISRIGGWCSPERQPLVVGMHFMNPVPLMPLIEVIPGLNSAPPTIELIVGLAKHIGKEPLLVNDSPGFVLNRLLIPMINEAIALLEQRVADAAAIDTIMKQGANMPMGPLALADLIGLDVVQAILITLQNELGDERCRPRPLLQRLVWSGKLGCKSGEGFYRYDGE